MGRPGDSDYEWERQPENPLAAEPLFQGGAPAQPTRPAYIAGYDPLTMQLTPELEKRLALIQMNQAGLQKYRGEALREGPSRWAGLAGQQQALEERLAMDRIAQESAGQTATARANLAMRGGLTSGARERIARGGSRDFLNMSQNLKAEGMRNRAQIGISDEMNRISQLGALPGMEAQALRPELEKTQLWGQGRRLDLGNAIRENEMRNRFNADVYGQQMQAWAAGRQAEATENSGK